MRADAAAALPEVHTNNIFAISDLEADKGHLSLPAVWPLLTLYVMAGQQCYKRCGVDKFAVVAV
jgi:hypothetical protein